MPLKPSESPEISSPNHYRMLICGALLSSMMAVGTGCDYSVEEPSRIPVPEENRSDDVRIVPDGTKRVPKDQPENEPEEYKPDKPEEKKPNQTDDGDEEKPGMLSCNNDCKFA